jgi:hypothetical protein
VVRLSALHLYPEEILLVLISVKRLSQPQGHSAAKRIMSMKIPLTPSGIKPMTFWFVMQCLNQVHHHIPLSSSYITEYQVRHDYVILFFIYAMNLPMRANFTNKPVAHLNQYNFRGSTFYNFFLWHAPK